MSSRDCKFCISIVSHNQQGLVTKLLESLDRYLLPGSVQVEVIITENVLNPDSINYKSNFKLKVIRNLRQRGFGANHNSVMSSVDFDYIWILNPDILLNQSVLLHNLIGEVGQMVVASPVVQNPYGEIEDFVRFELSITNLLKRKLLKSTYADFSNFDWIAGMALLFSKQTALRLRGFDERYFLYVEDCDLCREARTLNMQLKILEDFVVVHDARRNSRRSPAAFKLHLASLIKYWLK